MVLNFNLFGSLFDIYFYLFVNKILYFKYNNNNMEEKIQKKLVNYLYLEIIRDAKATYNIKANISLVYEKEKFVFEKENKILPI